MTYLGAWTEKECEECGDGPFEKWKKAFVKMWRGMDRRLVRYSFCHGKKGGYNDMLGNKGIGCHG